MRRTRKAPGLIALAIKRAHEFGPVYEKHWLPLRPVLPPRVKGRG